MGEAGAADIMKFSTSNSLSGVEVMLAKIASVTSSGNYRERPEDGRWEDMGLMRMESTEKCEVVIQHFNGKYLKTPPGVP
ncbi:hypothetical protein E2320_001987, partial [Naja naja]